MKAFDLNPGLSWLFVFAHPDDELAICSWIRRLARAGAAVNLLWCHATPERREEADCAAGSMGIAPNRRWFLDFPDGGMCERLSELREALAEPIARTAPARVVCADFEQGHLDHDAVNWAVHRSFEGPVCEFPEYWPYTPWIRAANRFADPYGEEKIELSPEETRFKIELARSYESQAIHRLMSWWHAASQVAGAPSELVKVERMRLSRGHDYRQPALAATSRRKPWKRWLSALERVEPQ